MRDPTKAKTALRRADAAADEIGRTLWLAKAAEYALAGRAVLVGGAAVNLHTGVYEPTDIDMCAYLDEADRESLRSLGFENPQGDHFSYRFTDGERWLLEFPDTEVDGASTHIELDQGELLEVITLEGLVIDRLLQATDGTKVTFEEALRLVIATMSDIDWDLVEHEVRRRSTSVSAITETYEAVVARSRELLA